MSITDPMADAITKIRNAYRADHPEVTVNRCKVVESVVRILADEKFINQYEVFERDPGKM